MSSHHQYLQIKKIKTALTSQKGTVHLLHRCGNVLLFWCSSSVEVKRCSGASLSKSTSSRSSQPPQERCNPQARLLLSSRIWCFKTPNISITDVSGLCVCQTGFYCTKMMSYFEVIPPFDATKTQFKVKKALRLLSSSAIRFRIWKCTLQALLIWSLSKALCETDHNHIVNQWMLQDKTSHQVLSAV